MLAAVRLKFQLISSGKSGKIKNKNKRQVELNDDDDDYIQTSTINEQWARFLTLEPTSIITAL